jgi:hypothetical protein
METLFWEVHPVADSVVFKDAEAAYGRSVADAGYVRAEWVKAGRPIVQSNPNGMSGIHPLLRAMWDAETLANRLRGELGRTPKSAKSALGRGPGRPVGAGSAPDRVRLKSV